MIKKPQGNHYSSDANPKLCGKFIRRISLCPTVETIIIIIIIDVAISSDRNVIQKESEEKLKYKNLSIEIQRMWNMKCVVIPVIIGATGIVTRRLKKVWKQYQESIQ
jgi:hypothetical protein